MSGKKIKKLLVLDDDESYGADLKEILEGEGYSVIVASTNEEAESILRGGGIDGFLSDWNLDPAARPKGPHADSTVRLAAEMGIRVLVRSGTDDSQKLLKGLIELGKGLVERQDKLGPIREVFRFFGKERDRC